MKFKVLNTPEGEAPLEIREEWVGITLPVDEVLGKRIGFGVISYAKTNMENAIAVSSAEAIRALRDAGKSEAADWWETIPQGQLLFEESWGELSD